MTERQERILKFLSERGPASTSYLGTLLDAPDASVRRDVQQLRAQGHNIVVDGTGSYSQFRLVKPRPYTPFMPGTEPDLGLF